MWRGQAFQCHMHVPHRAPRGCARHAPRGHAHHALVAVRAMPLAAVCTMPHRRWRWRLEPTPCRALCLEHQRLRLCSGGFLSPHLQVRHWRGSRSELVWCVRYITSCSGSPCTTQRRIAVCDAAAIAVRGTAAARRGSPCVHYGVPSTRHWVFSLPGTRRRVLRVPTTPTLKYLYPGCRVQVFRGWGRGSLSQPQGYPCQSLSTPECGRFRVLG